MRNAGQFGSTAVALALVVCATLPFPVIAGEIRRCLDGGHVTYTDRGCSQQGEVFVVAAMTPVSATARDQPGPFGRTTPVALGMSPRMVYEAMGRPIDTIATLEGRTLVEYWSYRSVEGTTRVAFQEGRVTRIQGR